MVVDAKRRAACVFRMKVGFYFSSARDHASGRNGIMLGVELPDVKLNFRPLRITAPCESPPTAHHSHQRCSPNAPSGHLSRCLHEVCDRPHSAPPPSPPSARSRLLFRRRYRSSLRSTPSGSHLHHRRASTWYDTTIHSAPLPV